MDGTIEARNTYVFFGGFTFMEAPYEHFESYKVHIFWKGYKIRKNLYLPLQYVKDRKKGDTF